MNLTELRTVCVATRQYGFDWEERVYVVLPSSWRVNWESKFCSSCNESPLRVGSHRRYNHCIESHSDQRRTTLTSFHWLAFWTPSPPFILSDQTKYSYIIHTYNRLIFPDSTILGHLEPCQSTMVGFFYRVWSVSGRNYILDMQF